MIKKLSPLMLALMTSSSLFAASESVTFGTYTDNSPKWNYQHSEYTNMGGIKDDIKTIDRAAYESAGYTIQQEILDTAFNSLPEGKKIDHLHPEYFPADEPMITVQDDSEVFVTFYHEGAGYRNTLAYYAYDGNSSNEFPGSGYAGRQKMRENGVIIIPNGSLPGSGGDVEFGTTVNLGKFAKDTKFIFFIVSNGWRNNHVRYDTWWLFSTWSKLNEEYQGESSEFEANAQDGAPDHRHVAMLWNNIDNDGKRSLLLGFEDIKRTVSSCDHDFNDAIFSIASSPQTALTSVKIDPTTGEKVSDEDGFAKVPEQSDRDGDGVFDPFDTYPDDPTRTHDSYYPSKEAKATLAYEDLWPFEGDYDMNDVTMSFNIKEEKDKDNKVKAFTFTGNVNSYGAAYYNGFAIAIDTLTDNIKSAKITIEGQAPVDAVVDRDQQTGNAVITLLDNKYNYISEIRNLFRTSGTNDWGALYEIGNDEMINVQKDATYRSLVDDSVTSFAKSRSFTLEVELENSVALMAPPYNPFLRVAGALKEDNFDASKYKNDGREVHLPNFAPTYADHSEKGFDWFGLFATEDDDSNLAATPNRTYKTEGNAPWAILIPTNFMHPVETVPVYKAYNNYTKWVESNGTEYQDWYLHSKDGYANENKIIIHD
jgi:hypothetical protein